MKTQHPRRTAFTLTELMVCASLLVTVMSFVASLSMRTNRLWKDTQHHKIALDELSNQLEILTTLDLSAAQQALPSLTISSQTLALLPGATLKASINQESSPAQVVLTHHLDDEPETNRPQHAPITLVGYLNSPVPPQSKLPTDQGSPTGAAANPDSEQKATQEPKGDQS